MIYERARRSALPAQGALRSGTMWAGCAAVRDDVGGSIPVG